MEHLTVTPSKARIRVSEKAVQQGGGIESGATPYNSSHYLPIFIAEQPERVKIKIEELILKVNHGANEEEGGWVEAKKFDQFFRGLRPVDRCHRR